jgi:hypothetical protein
MVCDLNQRPLPDLGEDVYDVAVLLGVLEYLRDVPAVLEWLAKHVQTCILGYACAKRNANSVLATLEVAKRLTVGWMNNYSEEGLSSLLAKRGFVLQRAETWKTQRLMVFSQYSATTEQSMAL